MYESLAAAYDDLQSADYAAWIDFYEAIFRKFGIRPELVLDIGCGTGNCTLPLAERGYNMIGLDLSEEMLGIATKKAKEKNLDILFLHQDMTAFELYGTVDAMICAMDGVNYLTEDGQVEKMLQLLHYYLNPGGLFIFDVNTEYKMQNRLSGNSFVYENDDVYCVWSSEYEPAEKLCYFDLNLFFRKTDGSYQRQDEYQTERAYTEAELRKSIENTGLKCVAVYGGMDFSAPQTDSERLFFVVQRP